MTISRKCLEHWILYFYKRQIGIIIMNRRMIRAKKIGDFSFLFSSLLLLPYSSWAIRYNSNWTLKILLLKMASSSAVLPPPKSVGKICEQTLQTARAERGPYGSFAFKSVTVKNLVLLDPRSMREVYPVEDDSGHISPSCQKICITYVDLHRNEIILRQIWVWARNHSTGFLV